MRPSWLLALALWPAVSQAAPADYRFEALAPVVERGVGVPLKVRIWSRTTNAAVAGADIRDAYVDRSPEGQQGGVLPAFFTPGLEYGVYNFRADLPTDGTWALKFTVRLFGEAQPLPASVVFKVVGRLPDAKPPNRRP